MTNDDYLRLLFPAFGHDPLAGAIDSGPVPSDASLGSLLEPSPAHNVSPLVQALTGIRPNFPGRNFLLGALAESPTKPRSRSEWEDRFVHWQKPASTTEAEKMDAARNRVARALRRSGFLASRKWEIIEQGSYHNNTNVRTDSDIDLAVRLNDAFFVDGPSGDVPSMAESRREPTPFTFQQYKDELARCFREELGTAAVQIGTKAIHLHKNDIARVSIDVVPAYTFELYGARSNRFEPYCIPTVGIAFPSQAGGLVTNFPRQHYENGCSKNELSRRRFKRVTRIIKRLRNHIAENRGAPSDARACASATPSFLIESLIFNCPPNVFGHPSIYDDVVAALHFLQSALSETWRGVGLLGAPRWAWWFEVNQAKPLFTDRQAWTVQSAASFIRCAASYLEI